ncbi:two-component system, NarL family, sensor kinase [Streptoalloteichus tenebrarius]|uniref:Two-component system, NarL family, sensor kinase n=1 Tax=Streptoalloteichus tenebrarius (strain ATCC 17920 / DSM 40477 / JCM 4838 / CBS 697.72 / NBRC 16177 / NCIMB 11028 / NRRL B-12390 / A12253. 1 / ISP 5477) TaxID=1933 RepID=A0ABT1HZ25_STRSD|nr:ATP-binding protein [Streptoalloteichus tenebrarius]MCP2260787.1 two-component system, NarL family, sensor kinase [Streptoalloteichus tenebrarius]BFF03397.1 ATP-binding protein [Streptoalloteichus tenebrarius]
MRGAGWARLLLVLPLSLGGLTATEGEHRVVFYSVVAAYVLWALGWLRFVTRPERVGPMAAVVAAVVDLVVITVLAALSRGPGSEARYAYFLLPVAAIPWNRAWLTAGVGLAGLVGHGVLVLAPLRPEDVANLDPSRGLPYDLLRAGTDASYLLWLTGMCTLLTVALGRRSERIQSLVDERERLLAEVLRVEDRERAALAEALHDGAVQNLLAVRLDLEEVAPEQRGAWWHRVREVVTDTVRELREAVFELHPRVLREAGLAQALRSLGERAAKRGRFTLECRIDPVPRHPAEQLVYSAARELLANVERHARASHVELRLSASAGRLRLSVRDDGVGIQPGVLRRRIAEGHIGLASQQVRITGAGGAFQVCPREGGGTVVDVELPY